jgi:hypothetical protein
MKRFLLTGALSLTLGAILLAAAPSKSMPQTSAQQPLTYANIVSYFKSTHLRATEVQKRCTVFFEGEWTSSNVYNYCLIIVENSDEDVQVTFYVTDAHEMNWVTEFLDSQLFAQSETKALFGLMNSSDNIKDRQIGRFRRVDFHRCKPRHAEILVFSFTPARSGQ